MLALLALVVTGCASAGVRPATPPTAADLARLEADLARDSSVAARVALGAAYRATGRLEPARNVLEPAVRANPQNASAVLYLGLTDEDLGRLEDARDLYRRYLEIGRAPELRKQIGQRLALLDHKLMAASVKEALASESELARSAPVPRTVAVFPFRFLGTDTTLEPLSRALASLLTTDLSQTDRLRVLERERVQLLLDEADLSRSGRVDSATIVRGGRLLRTEQLVEGSITGGRDQLQLSAAVVPTDDWNGKLEPFSVRDPLSGLFDMEKRLAFEIFRQMNIQLTPAERDRVLRRPTANVAALLAFGRGLEARDRGDFTGAAQQFEQAHTLDPAFNEAAQAAQQALGISSAQSVSTTLLSREGAQELLPPENPAGSLLSSPLGAGVGSASTLELGGVQALLPDPLFRDPGAEILGTEGLVSRAILQIILRRP